MNIVLYDYQEAMTTLSNTIKVIFDREQYFAKKNRMDEFATSLRRMNKKHKNFSPLCKNISNFMLLENIHLRINKQEAKLSRKGNEIIYEILEDDMYVNEVLANYRMRNYDNKLVYEKMWRYENIFRIEKFNVKDSDLIINKDKGNFQLKVDIISSDFFAAIENSAFSMDEFCRTIAQDNFLDKVAMEQKMIFNGKTKGFTYNDYLNCYWALYTMSSYYFEAENVYEKKMQEPSISSILGMKETMLISYIKNFFCYILKQNISVEVICEMLQFFYFGNFDIYDLYYQPILKYGDKI